MLLDKDPVAILFFKHTGPACIFPVEWFAIPFIQIIKDAVKPSYSAGLGQPYS